MFLQRENTVPDEIGTDHAILLESTALSVASRRTWGGRRNVASRVSHSIKLTAALELVEAAQRASDLGLPYNRHVTIHWERGGVGDHQAAAATGKFIKLLSDWVRKRGGKSAYSWVRENGDGKGSHVHILLHLPLGWHFGQMTRRWLKAIVGNPPTRMVKTDPIAGWSQAAFSGSDWYWANLAHVTGYVLKGVDPESGKLLDLDRSGCGGRIIGKRSSVSQNLRPLTVKGNVC